MSSRALDHRLRQPVAIAEMVVGVVERRRRLELQAGDHLDARAPGRAASSCSTSQRPRSAASRANRMAMAWRSGPAVPSTQCSGAFAAGVAEHLGARRHARPELVGKGRQRFLVEPERPQPVPGEGDRHPAARFASPCRPPPPSGPSASISLQPGAVPASASRKDRKT